LINDFLIPTVLWDEVILILEYAIFFCRPWPFFFAFVLVSFDELDPHTKWNVGGLTEDVDAVVVGREVVDVDRWLICLGVGDSLGDSILDKDFSCVFCDNNNSCCLLILISILNRNIQQTKISFLYNP
jgi:hypothetical protein